MDKNTALAHKTKTAAILDSIVQGAADAPMRDVPAQDLARQDSDAECLVQSIRLKAIRANLLALITKDLGDLAKVNLSAVIRHLTVLAARKETPEPAKEFMAIVAARLHYAASLLFEENARYAKQHGKSCAAMVRASNIYRNRAESLQERAEAIIVQPTQELISIVLGTVIASANADLVLSAAKVDVHKLYPVNNTCTLRAAATIDRWTQCVGIAVPK